MIAASQPFMLTHVWIIPGLMAVSFLVILLLGKRFSERVTSGIGIFFIGVCFVLACVTAVNWVQRVNHPVPDASAAEAVISQPSNGGPSPVPGMTDAEAVVGAEVGPAEAAADAGHAASPEAETTPTSAATGSESTTVGSESTAAEGDHAAEGEHEAKAAPIVTRWTWFTIGDINFEFGFIADGLSILMLFTVTAISLLVHIYSKEYLHDDVRFTHYYAFLSLFSAAMLFYVTSSNTIQMLTGWELVGVCSFALIGHWWEDKNNSDAALKAFLTNRVGDVGLIIGVIITFFAAGSTSFNVLHINQYALSPAANQTLLLVGALCLFGGVTSKSGQFPLHTWLPDAMAGPTPVSALIHAATMVVAGIYLVARLYSVFYEGLNIGDNWVNYVAVIGGITIVGGAALAFVQNDIKKVLAYSTISQLGYMVMALGVGAWTGAIFHLFTHAFFKACLFLGAGSVSHAAHHTFDMRKMGGLRKYMPTTFWTFVIGTLALMGIFPFAGFWSKDEVLAGSLDGQQPRLHPDAGDGPHRRGHDVCLHAAGHLPHLLRRVPRPRHAARVAQGHDRPAVDPGRRRHRAGSGQPAGRLPGRQRRLHHTVRALHRAHVRLPGHQPRRVQLGCSPDRTLVIAAVALLPGLPVLLAAEEPAHRPQGQEQGLRRGATGCSRTSTASTTSTPTSSSAA